MEEVALTAYDLDRSPRTIETAVNPRLGKVGVEERLPPRQTSRVELLKAKVEPLLTFINSDKHDSRRRVRRSCAPWRRWRSPHTIWTAPMNPPRASRFLLKDITLNGFRKSTPPQNRQLIVLINHIK